MTTNLIDRYTAEIGKHLSLKGRADIQKEIRSTLEDMLDERAKKSGREPDEAMVVDLLKGFGKPEDVAASYLPERRLIGPQLYPIFSLVVSIVLPILAAVLLITMSIGSFAANLTAVEVFKTIGNILLEVVSALVSAFGSIVITFALLERIPWSKAEFRKDKEQESKDWNPRDLPEVRDVEKFSIPGLMVEIALTFAAIVIFNFYPNIIGIGFLLNDKWTYLPILSEAFFRYVPYLTGLWGLHIVLNLFLLSQGKWQTVTRWLDITLKALGLALTVVMLAGPDLIGSSAAALTAAGTDLSADAANVLTWLPRIGVKIALVVVVVVDGIEVMKLLFREITGKSRA